MQNTFAGLNENMAAILANTSIEGFTPSNLFKNILEDKNQVSEYFRSNSDIERIILDFQESHNKQDTDSNYEGYLKKALSKVTDSTQDRYLNEIKFMTVILENRKLSKVFNNIVGKYLNPIHVLGDFQRIQSPTPILDWAKIETTILDVVGKDMTALARAGELHTIVGREEEMMRLVQVLTRQTKSNPVLVGDAGVGKTAIVEKLAHVLTDNSSIPSGLHDYRLYEISIAAIMSSESVEDTVAEMLSVCAKDKIILFMDEVHMVMDQKAKLANLLKPAMARGDIKLVGATTEDEFRVFEKDKAMTRRFQPVKVNEPDNIAVYTILKEKALEAENIHNVLIPHESLLKAIQLSERYIQHRQQPDKAIDLVEEASAKLRMIIEAKPEPLIDVQRKISDASVNLEMLTIQNEGRIISPRTQKKMEELVVVIAENEAERDRLQTAYDEQRKLLTEVIRLKSVLVDLKTNHKKALHVGDFETAVLLEVTTIPEAEQAIMAAEQVILEFAKNADENLIQNVVVPNMIARIIEDQTGIPVLAQDQDDIEKYRNMGEALKEKVRGQEKPIETITAAIKRSKAGLADPNKPLGSFLELGPTGVGKTLLAQEISKFMFDTDKVMHRFDMSEYMEGHSVSRLFGSPPGYVGHDEGGQLTEAVRRNPYSIILFDEIEKAHSKIFDALLQILDAGRMTDGKGNVVDFKNTVIIMTSNIGSQIIRVGLEQGHPIEGIEMALFDEIKKHFRPEFLNRFDAKVMFNSLSPEVVVDIADAELHKLSERLITENNLELHWHPDVPVEITNQAYDVNDGARPIKRFINNTIVNLLTEAILDQTISSGDNIYLSTADGEMIIFPISYDELAVLQKEQEHETTLDAELIEKTTVSSKVDASDIVDAEIDDIDSGSDPDDMDKELKAAKKKLKKKKKKDSQNLASKILERDLSLKTQAD